MNAIESLGRDLRERQYTHVAIATEDPGGYRLAASVGAPTRSALRIRGAKPLKALWSRRMITTPVYRSARLTAHSPHECETLFKLVEPLIGEKKPTHDLAQLRPLVLESESAPDGRVAVQITDKWERLGIPIDSVVDLVRRSLRAASFVSWRCAANPPTHIGGCATGIAVSYFDDLPSWKASIAAAVRSSRRIREPCTSRG